MQFSSTFAALVGVGLSLSALSAPRPAVPFTDRDLSLAADSILTADPLTGLPLSPATVCRTDVCIQFHTGNAPLKMPGSQICKSKMQADFYSLVYRNAKVDATVAWYASHLAGFKKTHAYAHGRSNDTFYNPAGTMFVLVMGNPAKDGENADTYAITYYRVQPGLHEKTSLPSTARRSTVREEGGRPVMSEPSSTKASPTSRSAMTSRA